MEAMVFSLLFLGAAVYVALAMGFGKPTAAKLTLGLFGGAFKLAGKLFVFCFNGLRHTQISPPSSSGAPRILSPGDSYAPSNRAQDYADYRGVATERELAALRAPGIGLGRYLHPRGRRGGALSLPTPMLHRNCAVIGPPGSGKTEGVIVPWILELLGHGCSVVTVDVKGDLVDRLEPGAAQIGARTWYWNSGDPGRSQSWNWLDTPPTDRNVETAVISILGRPKPGDSQPFFYERDCRWLRALIGIVKQLHGPMARSRHLYELVADQQALRDAFHQHPAIRRHATEVADLLQLRADEHSRAVSGLLNALHLFNSSNVSRVTQRSDIRLSEISDRSTLLVIGASLADGRAGEVLSSIMLNMLFNQVYSRFGTAASGPTRPLFFIIDEAARLKDRVNYEELLSVSRSAGAGFCLAAQDVAQFGDERQVSAILSNCLSLMVLRGCSPDTARFLSARLGQRTDQATTVSQQRGPFDLLSQRGATIQQHTVPVLAEREIMHQPGTYSAIVHTPSVCPKPFLVDLARPVP